MAGLVVAGLTTWQYEGTTAKKKHEHRISYLTGGGLLMEGQEARPTNLPAGRTAASGRHHRPSVGATPSGRHQGTSVCARPASGPASAGSRDNQPDHLSFPDIRLEFRGGNKRL